MDDKEMLKVIVIGVGGLVYGGLTRMANFLVRQEVDELVLIDGDSIEEKNKRRQWANRVGMHKVCVAGAMLRELRGHDVAIREIARMYERGAAGFEGAVGECDEEVMVIVLPDNDRARIAAYEWAKEISGIVESGTCFLVMAGNGLDSGYASGCVWAGGQECKGDVLARRPEIALEARKEEEMIAHPQGCGDMGGEEQSVQANMLTAYCVWEVADALLRGEVGEYRWQAEEKRRYIVEDMK